MLQRPRTEDNIKSNIAIMHEHEHNQKIAHVKQEKKADEASLETVRGEKEAVGASLEKVKIDLEDSNELVGQLTLTTNIWQGRFDELASFVQAGGPYCRPRFQRPVSNFSRVDSFGLESSYRVIVLVVFM